MNEGLELQGVHTHIGGYHILRGVDFQAPAGRTLVLLGRNGAGKTTTLRTVMGMWRASAGSIRFNGSELVSSNTAAIAGNGVAYVPEKAGIFPQLSVAENMLLGARSARRLSDVDRDRLDWLFGLFPALHTFWNAPAGKLSGGQRQMLAVARAACEPRALLLVDEPSKGLSPALVDRLVDALTALHREGTAIVLVEQNFAVAAEVGEDVAVMDNGRIVHTGRMRDLVGAAQLQRQLLGFSLGPTQ